MFTPIADAQAVISSRGAYRPAGVASLGGQLFVTYGSGYVAVMKEGKTSKEGVFLHRLEGAGQLYSAPFGYLYVEPAADRRPITSIRTTTHLSLAS